MKSENMKMLFFLLVFGVSVVLFLLLVCGNSNVNENSGIEFLVEIVVLVFEKEFIEIDFFFIFDYVCGWFNLVKYLDFIIVDF